MTLDAGALGAGAAGNGAAPSARDFGPREIVLHGHRVIYRTASALLALAARRRLLTGRSRAGATLRNRGWSKGVYLRAIARALRPLEQAGSREASSRRCARSSTCTASA